MWMDRIQHISITNHAIQRMKERGCNPEEVISFLRKSNELILLRNHRGYEIIMPLKGRLAGDFDGETFIVKSFLLPSRFGKDYYVNGRKSRDGCTVRVSSLSYPRIGLSLSQRGNTNHKEA